MVNTSIEGAIQLFGRGYIDDIDSPGYEPGAYKRLLNAEITAKGTLRNRRSVKAVHDSAIMESVHFVGGNWFDTMVLFGDQQIDPVIVNESGSFLWPYMTNVEKDDHTPVGFFTFLDKFYVIHDRVVNTFPDTISSVVVSYDTLPSAFKTETSVAGTYLSSQTFGGGSTVTVATESMHTTYSNKQIYVSDWKVFRDRLWLAVGDTLYFSTSGFPEDWTTGNGFGRFPGMHINQIVPYRDTVYVFCDTAIYAYTYSNDPNDVNDLSVVTLTTSLGAQSAVLHNDIPYFVNNDKLYAINNNRVEVVSDLDLPLSTNNYDGFIELTSWFNYIIIHKYESVEGEFFTHLPKMRPASILVEGSGGRPDLSYTETNVYFMDVDSLSIHQFDFADQLGATSYPTGTMQGYPIDFYVNTTPTNTSSGMPILYIMGGIIQHSTNTCLTSTLNYMLATSYGGGAGPVEQFGDELLRGDVESMTTGLNRPEVNIQIDSYTPDGSEFLIKKFRNLMIQGRFPKSSDDGLQMYFDFDDSQDWPVGPFNLGVDSEDTRYPMPLRIGVNQRGRTLSIKLWMDWLEDLDSATSHVFELSDMRAYWTYTGKAPA